MEPLLSNSKVSSGLFLRDLLHLFFYKATFINRLLCAALALYLGLPIAFSEEAQRADKIRAALIYNLIKFTSFPQINTDKLIICLSADLSSASVLTELLAQKSLHQRTVEIVKLQPDLTQEQFKSCNAVVADQEFFKVKIRSILETSKIKPFSICTTEELKWIGCIVEIFEQDNKARIAVDSMLLDSSGYKLSSEVLQLVTIKR